MTRPGVYGDKYYIDADQRMCQANCSPYDYLVRSRLWKEIFKAAPEDFAITEAGQIVSRQEFVIGKTPTQETIDDFLAKAGMIAVRQKYWLWKKSFETYDVWVGDARTDNFVETAQGVVPIDIRIWIEE